MICKYCSFSWISFSHKTSRKFETIRKCLKFYSSIKMEDIKNGEQVSTSAVPSNNAVQGYIVGDKKSKYKFKALITTAVGNILIFFCTFQSRWHFDFFFFFFFSFFSKYVLFSLKSTKQTKQQQKTKNKSPQCHLLHFPDN